MANRLQYESSPYLLQHKDNPVDWYPWGEEAFEKAKREDKPIFLSIGYATCHWCHVMEHESFEDEAVARLMNEAFVSIKVDREERPDIDTIYMTACQLLTGHGGWPLTVVMTPDKEPFFAGTYLPKESRFQRMGMMQFVPRIQHLWMNERERVLNAAAGITASLQQTQVTAGSEQPTLGSESLHVACQQFEKRYDAEEGGFGQAPKFPTPHALMFLLRYWKRTGEQHALDMVTHTLTRMRMGGLFDHVGFGFHRYATDAAWVLPHFEKMLYDQALLMMAYAEAYQATRKPFFADTVRELVDYIERVLSDPDGGFYSAEDADSEGEEGKFYIWSLQEVEEVVGVEARAWLAEQFNLTVAGNFEDEATRQRTGHNQFFRTRTQKVASADDPERWAQLRIKLFAHREQRIHPLKDDKVLTDWNGLMIAALAKAGQALQDQALIARAERAVAFLEATMLQPSGRLWHRYRNGDAAIEGHIDDYAFFVWGLIELYEATGTPRYLKRALQLQEILMAQFWDEEAGGFYFTAADAEQLLMRPKEFYDGAIPSGNSIALLNMVRLSRLTGETRWEQHAAAVARAASAYVQRMPSGFAGLLLGIDFATGKTHEITLVTESEDPTFKTMRALVQARFSPNKVLLQKNMQTSAELSELAGFTQSQTAIEGRATAYVCEGFVCQAPVTEVHELVAALG